MAQINRVHVDTIWAPHPGSPDSINQPLQDKLNALQKDGITEYTLSNFYTVNDRVCVTIIYKYPIFNY